jgi:hypothetical protein
MPGELTRIWQLVCSNQCTKWSRCEAKKPFHNGTENSFNTRANIQKNNNQPANWWSFFGLETQTLCLTAEQVAGQETELFEGAFM